MDGPGVTRDNRKSEAPRIAQFTVMRARRSEDVVKSREKSLNVHFPRVGQGGDDNDEQHVAKMVQVQRQPEHNSKQVVEDGRAGHHEDNGRAQP